MVYVYCQICTAFLFFSSFLDLKDLLSYSALSILRRLAKIVFMIILALDEPGLALPVSQFRTKTMAWFEICFLKITNDRLMFDRKTVDLYWNVYIHKLLFYWLYGDQTEEEKKWSPLVTNYSSKQKIVYSLRTEILNIYFNWFLYLNDYLTWRIHLWNR